MASLTLSLHHPPPPSPLLHSTQLNYSALLATLKSKSSIIHYNTCYISYSFPFLMNPNASSILHQLFSPFLLCVFSLFFQVFKQTYIPPIQVIQTMFSWCYSNVAYIWYVLYYSKICCILDNRKDVSKGGRAFLENLGLVTSVTRTFTKTTTTATYIHPSVTITVSGCSVPPTHTYTLCPEDEEMESTTEMNATPPSNT